MYLFCIFCHFIFCTDLEDRELAASQERETEVASTRNLEAQVRSVLNGVHAESSIKSELENRNKFRNFPDLCGIFVRLNV